MGRYTGVVSLSSTNPNVAKISYAEAVGLATDGQRPAEGAAGARRGARQVQPARAAITVGCPRSWQQQRREDQRGVVVPKWRIRVVATLGGEQQLSHLPQRS